MDINNEAARLRAEIEAISDKLCLAVGGDFSFTVEINTPDESLQKMGMLINFVLDTARRSLAAIKEKNDKLTELDRLKSDFIANVSHELRTPLTLILGPLHAILDDASTPIPTAYREDLLRVQRNANRLYWLVNDLLDFSKVEAGKQEIHEELLDIDLLFSEIISDAEGLATERKLTLYYDGCKELNSILGDRKMLEKILLNLLSNAMKFTPEKGKIHVQLSKQGNWIQLSVADTGQGISRDQFQHIFDRFHQVDSSSTRTHEGTGIGLALVHEFVRLLGGEITVESEEGEGTTFILKFPLRMPSVQKKSDPAKKENVTSHAIKASSRLAVENQDGRVSPPQKAEGVLPLILLVDDNADICSYVASLLQDSYEIITANNGKMALNAIYQRHPELVLSDVMMPVMDGYQLTKAIKTDPAIRHIPIILMTAKAGKEAVVAALDALADDYLSKPFSVEELRARVGSAHRAYKNHCQLMEVNSKLIATAKRAGMSDIATSILHNIGNILNSANISVNVLRENINTPHVNNIIKISSMIKEHASNEGEFFTQDPKGKFVPDYLMTLVKTLSDERKKCEEEIDGLSTHIKHIEDVVGMQKVISGVSSVGEKFFLPDVVRDAVKICGNSAIKNGIQIKEDFRDSPFLFCDKSKVLQILINLIQNAKDSFVRQDDYEFPNKYINIKIEKIKTAAEKREREINIEVADNGSGISSENLTKIFNFGFTTKKDGHGFGLHSSALSAIELGGALLVKSDGLGKGATFNFTLPDSDNSLEH